MAYWIGLTFWIEYLNLHHNYGYMHVLLDYGAWKVLFGFCHRCINDLSFSCFSRIILAGLGALVFRLVCV